MHFDGKASLWYQKFSQKNIEITWPQFLDVISARLEEIKESKMVAEFNKLKQIGSFVDYVDEFE